MTLADAIVFHEVVYASYAHVVSVVVAGKKYVTSGVLAKVMFMLAYTSKYTRTSPDPAEGMPLGVMFPSVSAHAPNRVPPPGVTAA
jgi:hypothetical protein